MADHAFRPEVGSSIEKLAVDPDVVSRSLINGPNRDAGPVIFNAEDMASTGDYLEVYLADDPNPLEIHFPTENFVEFRRDVRSEGIHSKGQAQIDLLDDIYPVGPGVSWARDRVVSLSLGRGRDNFEGFGPFESSRISRQHCQISFDLTNKTLVIENFEHTTNQTEVVRKHQEASIDDFTSSTDTSASPEAEAPSQSPESGVLKKHFDKFMEKFEETPSLFKDYAATSKEASYRSSPFENEDRLVVNEKAGVFAVFDGMGGGSGGALAADIAAEITGDYFNHKPGTEAANPQEALIDLANLMDKINSSILDAPKSKESGTTATAFRLVAGNQGVTSLAWVHVGDSRLYLSRKHDSMPRQLTTDETANDVPDDMQGSMLTNCIGWRKGAFRGVKHSGIIEVASGDRIILCTDGVTGDKGKELLSAPEIYQFTDGLDASGAAKSLVKNARKIDDKSAIVVDL